MNNKLNIVKMAAKFVVGSGVSKIMGDIITNNTTPAVGTEDKVKVAAGSVVLGLMVADHASDYVDHAIDEAAAFWQSFKSKKDDTEQN